MSDFVTIAERSPTTVSFSTLCGLTVVLLFSGVAWVVAPSVTGGFAAFAAVVAPGALALAGLTTPCLGVVVLSVAASAVEDPTKETADAMSSAGQGLRRGEREDMRPRATL
ncbi:hypothetical protein APE01nite_12690 [Acetobacter peroxydans]|uniref:Uncharacterized protein n=1 Tax=Acetobacter peroxydans TaxID=104098 RepID=A0A4Y3TUE1_9PROT|nr:hypothetical protein AA0475_0025 [Acetobacter peroxydans]GEB85472.1 hypothetical protein APE01nite_12690 [Acetobacter peroxydans]